MDALAVEYASEAHHLFIYTRETHPENFRDVYEPFQSYEEKIDRAKELRDRFHSPRRFLVDTLDGDIHRAYSGVPNMSWVLDHTGRIVFKGSWTKINDVRSGLERAIQMREIKRGNTVIIQYYRENIEYTVTKRPIASSYEANALDPNVS